MVGEVFFFPFSFTGWRDAAVLLQGLHAKGTSGVQNPDIFGGSEEQGKPFVHTCRRFPNYYSLGGEQSVTLFLLFFFKKKERQSKLLSYNGTSVMQLCELGLHGQKHYCLPGKLKRPPIKIRSKTAFLPRRLGPARVFQAEFVVTLSIRSLLSLPAGHRNALFLAHGRQ